MNEQPNNELPEETDGATLWPVGGFGDMEPDAQGEIFPPLLWQTLNRQGMIEEEINRFQKAYFEHSAVPPGFLSKKFSFRRRLSLDTALLLSATFLFGVAIGLTVAAFLDARLPQ